MEHIELTLTDAGWMARSDDPEVQRLFGTNTVPTAYTERTSAERVLSAIQMLNPDAIVVISEPAGV